VSIREDKTTIAFVNAITILTVIFLMVCGGSVYFLTSKQNELAQSSARQMMKSGISNVANQLNGFAYDYSAWDAAFENVPAVNLDWIYPNMASAIEAETFDLLS
jgi:sensor domain CHASE-containing protein